MKVRAFLFFSASLNTKRGHINFDTPSFPVQVVFDTKTFWLSQQRMAELFGVTVPNIVYHLQQIENSGEIHLSDAIKKILIPSDKWSGEVMMYNLDVVIAVGYRVNTARCRKCDA